MDKNQMTPAAEALLRQQWPQFFEHPTLQPYSIYEHMQLCPEAGMALNQPAPDRFTVLIDTPTGPVTLHTVSFGWTHQRALKDWGRPDFGRQIICRKITRCLNAFWAAGIIEYGFLAPPMAFPMTDLPGTHTEPPQERTALVVIGFSRHVESPFQKPPVPEELAQRLGLSAPMTPRES